MTSERFVLEPAGEGQDLAGVVVILWHGAGGDVGERSLAAVAGALAKAGARVARARFAYRRAGRRFPDRMPQLVADARETIAEVRVSAGCASGPLILGGRSMGGRVASMLVAEGDPVTGLLFLGYPLHPEGKPEALRDAHLYRLETPMLFIQGDRDTFAEMARLRPVLDRLGDRAELALFPGADHSLKRAPLPAIVEAAMAWAISTSRRVRRA